MRIAIGKRVKFFGRTWTVVGKNYLGDWDVVRYENRHGMRFKIQSSISSKPLPKDHPHYAEVP